MWDEEALEKELNTKIRAQRAHTPEELVRTRYFIDLDEDTVISGFPSVLEEKAYNGYLSFDEYVLFIENSYWKDVLQLKIKPEINWKKVQKGVNKRIDYLKKNNDYHDELSKMILPENRDCYSVGALETYDLIYEKIYDKKILMFENNRNEYLEYCKTPSDQILYGLLNKRFDRFDQEMAIATTDLFKQLSNYEKHSFSKYFYDMWELWDTNPDVKKTVTKKGFLNLKTRLQQDRREYDKIGVYHINSFIQRLDTLLANKNEITEGKTNED